MRDDGSICPKCEQQHVRQGRPCCKGHRNDGGPCHRWPADGAPVCRQCGGTARQVVDAAKRRRIEREARQAMTTYGLPVDVDPAEALLQEVHHTAGHVAWLREQVAAISPEALVWGRTKTRQGRGAEGPIDVTDEGAELNVWLQLYQQERKHLVAVCSAALSAGVEERRVRLAESQGATLAGVIRAVLDDLGLSAAQLERVAEVVPRHLRAVAG